MKCPGKSVTIELSTGSGCIFPVPSDNNIPKIACKYVHGFVWNNLNLSGTNVQQVKHFLTVKYLGIMVYTG